MKYLILIAAVFNGDRIEVMLDVSRMAIRNFFLYGMPGESIMALWGMVTWVITMIGISLILVLFKKITVYCSAGLTPLLFKKAPH